MRNPYLRCFTILTIKNIIITITIIIIVNFACSLHVLGLFASTCSSQWRCNNFFYLKKNLKSF